MHATSSSTSAPNTTLAGARLAVVAMVFFSLNDAAMKYFSDGYALHQIVLIRSTIAMLIIGVAALIIGRGFSLLRSRRPGLNLLRGAFVVTANMSFFLGLAAMPLAEAVAIFFISPLVITVMSVVILRETVGPRRWGAILVGFAGVLIIVRPGTQAFQVASLLPMLAAVCYGALHMATRIAGRSDTVWSLTFWVQWVFIGVALFIGLAVGDGRFAAQDDPSLAFFFRAWVWPPAKDYLLLLGTGVVLTGGAFLISRAYVVSEAALVAPFEYVAMPMAILWGYVLFGEWPENHVWGGIVLIIGSGLFLMWREAQVAPENTPDTGRPS